MNLWRPRSPIERMPRLPSGVPDTPQDPQPPRPVIYDDRGVPHVPTATRRHRAAGNSPRLFVAGKAVGLRPAPRPGNIEPMGPLEIGNIHRGSVVPTYANQKRPSVSWPVALAAVAIVLGLAGMSVALAFAGWKPESITGFVMALGTGLGSILAVVGRMLSVNADQTQALAEIHESTNGKLSASEAQLHRLERALRAAGVLIPNDPAKDEPRRGSGG
jgi:hypothetical protein